MKEFSTWVILHIIVCLVFGTVKWISKGKLNSLNKLTYLYLMTAVIGFSIVITDSIIGMIYTTIFGIVLMISNELSGQELKSDKLVKFLVSIITATIMFIYSSKFVLVRPLTVIMIFYIPLMMITNRTGSQSTKDKIIGAGGLLLIIFSGLMITSNEANPYPTKQSLIVEEYIEQHYEGLVYNIYCIDSTRGSKSSVTVDFKSSKKSLVFEYENNSITNVDEN